MKRDGLKVSFSGRMDTVHFRLGSNSHIDDVIQYFINQDNHHKKASFKEEYLNLLEKFDVDFDPRYLFKWI